MKRVSVFRVSIETITMCMYVHNGIYEILQSYNSTFSMTENKNTCNLNTVTVSKNHYRIKKIFIQRSFKLFYGKCICVFKSLDNMFLLSIFYKCEIVITFNFIA